MAGYELVRLDGGGRIPLPEGETVLGRGPLLGVSDKRVSRQHGLLENLNGRLRLKPVHVNPCFSLQGGALPRPLERERWHPLRHGELFSLMPGSFIYRVEALGGAPLTPRARGGLGGDDVGPTGARPSPSHDETAPHGIGHMQTPPPAHSPVSEEARAGLSSEEARAGLSSEETRAGLSSEETRAGLSSEEARAGLSSEEARAGLSSEEAIAGLSSEEARAGLSSEEARAGLSSEEARAGLSSEDHGDEDSSGSAPRRKRRRKNTPTDKPLPPPRYLSNSPGEEDCGRLSDEGASGSDVRPDRKSTPPGGAGSGHAPSQSTRPRCPYGEDCYRKNPLHFQECCHPGDHDYQQEEEEPEEEVDRPECPYGIDCYRKNPLHRKEYQHSRRAARTSRRAPSTPAGDDEDEDEDSFINDSSDEAFDDSDYDPAGSDDSGQEDFLKSRK
ncbi:unnamed protein product [Lota lota]